MRYILIFLTLVIFDNVGSMRLMLMHPASKVTFYIILSHKSDTIT